VERIVVECVSPELEGGRYPVKRVVGDLVEVGADIFKEGHDQLAARVRVRAPGESGWHHVPMTHDKDLDRWFGVFPVDRIGRWTFCVEAWTDAFGTWRSELKKKTDAGQDVSSELLEGAELVDWAARKARAGAARTWLKNETERLRDTSSPASDRFAIAMAPGLLAAVEANFAPRDLTEYRRELEITVDRERARFASWYELFPRSQTSEPDRHGTFADAEERLPRLAELGFDVIYLPPIHPIGHSFRKGRNNALEAEPGDVGSPWAIGNEHGGHDAVDPNLGTIEDFVHFRRRTEELGMEVALDYALQCSPDHPWLKEHPEWFFIRPDGSIKYAENPPKKYQDIYPLNFWCDDREALWEACRDLFLFWIGHGVKIFRVDNPHTKAFQFWEWCIAEIQREHPDVIFFAEAFTRPKKLKSLAKVGFTMSYSYFTWKNTSYELRQFWEEMWSPEALEYLRHNLFANTPDILHEYLVHGGRPAFRVRLLLAATMSSLYGIYSGFELAENVPVRPGSEEYLNSEKYELRPRDYEAPGNLNADIQRLNRIRRENPALQRMDNLTFHPSENEHILFFRKAARREPQRVRTVAADVEGPILDVPDGDILIAVNLDPHRPQDTMLLVPIGAMGIALDEAYVVHDLLTGARYTWRGARNYVRLDPGREPGHVLRVERMTTPGVPA
jgi:starch synthase (maltosyl-transferring)